MAMHPQVQSLLARHNDGLSDELKGTISTACGLAATPRLCNPILPMGTGISDFLYGYLCSPYCGQ